LSWAAAPGSDMIALSSTINRVKSW
jgi:hypothetical protein